MGHGFHSYISLPEGMMYGHLSHGKSDNAYIPCWPYGLMTVSLGNTSNPNDDDHLSYFKKPYLVAQSYHIFTFKGLVKGNILTGCHGFPHGRYGKSNEPW